MIPPKEETGIVKFAELKSRVVEGNKSQQCAAEYCVHNRDTIVHTYRPSVQVSSFHFCFHDKNTLAKQFRGEEFTQVQVAVHRVQKSKRREPEGAGHMPQSRAEKTELLHAWSSSPSLPSSTVQTA